MKEKVCPVCGQNVITGAKTDNDRIEAEKAEEDRQKKLEALFEIKMER